MVFFCYLSPFYFQIFGGDIFEAGINEVFNFFFNKDIPNMVSISLFITLNRQDCKTAETEANMTKQTNGTFTYYVIREEEGVVLVNAYA